jgi:hypothetical protein
MMIILLFIYQFITMATQAISITPTSKTLGVGMSDNQVTLWSTNTAGSGVAQATKAAKSYLDGDGGLS